MAKNIDLDALKLTLDELKANGQIGYEETVLGDTLTWDGTDSDVVIDFGNCQFYLASELLPPIDFIETLPNTIANFKGIEGSFSGKIVNICEYVYFDHKNISDVACILVYEDNLECSGVAFPKKGIYLPKIEGVTYIQSLTIEGANCFPTSTPKQIDSKYRNDVTFVKDSHNKVTCNKSFNELEQMWRNRTFGSINVIYEDLNKASSTYETTVTQVTKVMAIGSTSGKFISYTDSEEIKQINFDDIYYVTKSGVGIMS